MTTIQQLIKPKLVAENPCTTDMYFDILCNECTLPKAVQDKLVRYVEDMFAPVIQEQQFVISSKDKSLTYSIAEILGPYQWELIGFKRKWCAFAKLFITTVRVNVVLNIVDVLYFNALLVRAADKRTYKLHQATLNTGFENGGLAAQMS